MIVCKLSFNWTVSAIESYAYQPQKTLDMIAAVSDHFGTLMSGVSKEDLHACQREEVVDKATHYPNDNFLPLPSIKGIIQERLDRLGGVSLSVTNSPENKPIPYVYRVPPVCTHTFQVFQSGAPVKWDVPDQETVTLLATLEFWNE